MNNKSTIPLYSIALLLFACSAQAVTDIATSGSVPGEWTSDIDAARAYARTNKTFFLINFGKTSGCSQCAQADSAIYSRSEFTLWAKNSNIPLVYADYVKTENDPLIATVRRLYPLVSVFPSIIIVDEREKGERAIGSFYVAPDKIQNGIYWNPFNTANFARTLDSYLDHADDFVTKPIPTLTVSAAQQNWHLYGQYGTNSLNAFTNWLGGRLIVRYADTNDWYSITNIVAKGRKYKITATDVQDPANIASARFYSNKANAASSNAFAAVSLLDLTNGFSFLAQQPGTNYIQFTRPATSDYVKVEYNFTYSYTNVPVYSLGTNAMAVDEGSSVTLSVSRSNVTNVPTSVGYFLTGATPVDVDSSETSGTLNFAAGQTNATLTLGLQPNDTLWRSNRSFTVTLQTGAAYDADVIVSNTVVTVRETDPEFDVALHESSANNATATNALALGFQRTPETVSATLNGRDVIDWFRFTNVLANIKCQLTLQNVQSTHASVATNLTLALYTNAAQAAAGSGAWLSAVVSNGAVILFTPLTASDLYLSLSRSVGVGEPVGVSYTLGYSKLQNPVVWFAQQAQSVPDTNGTVQLTIFRTNSTDAATTARFATLNGTATNGIDYTVPASTVVFPSGSTNQALTITIPADGGIWKGNRDFQVTLLPDGAYDAGPITNMTVTITESDLSLDGFDHGTADTQPTNAWPLAMSLSNATLSATLNDQDTADWFVFTNLVARSRYRFDITHYTNVNAANARAALYTNSAAEIAAGGTQPWADLTLSNGLCHIFSPDTTNDLYLAIRRDAAPGKDVCVKYDLSYREWPRAVIGFGSTNVPALADQSAVTLQVVRTVQTNEASAVSFHTADGTALAEGDYTATNGVLSFAAGETNKPVTILLHNTNTTWMAERAFQVILTATTDVTLTNDTATVTRDADPAGDGSDTADDAPEGATALTMDLAKGATALRYLSASDTNDWFFFSNIQTGKQYRVHITNYLAKSANPVADFFYTNQQAVANCTDIPLSALTVSTWYPLALGDNATNGVWLRISRPAGANAYVRYLLEFREWIRPVIGFATNAVTVKDTDGQLVLTVKRTNNLDLAQVVGYAVSPADALFGTDYSGSPNGTLSFASGESSQSISIDILPDGNVWRSDRAFKVGLAVDAETTAGVTNLTVTITDNEPAYDSADGADGSADAAYGTATRLAMMSTNRYLAASLNAADTNDWFVFTNMQARVRYRVAVTNLTVANVAAASVQVSFFTNAAAAAANQAWTNMPLSALTNRLFDFTSATTNDVYARCQRPAGANVCVKYTLIYSVWPRPVVTFATNAVTVWDTNTVVNVVVWGTNTTADATGVVTFVTADLAGGGTSAGRDYTFTNGTIRIPANTTTSQVIAVRLAQDTRNVWTGDRTFAVTLTPGSGTESVITNLTVTIAERDDELDAYDNGTTNATPANAWRLGMPPMRASAALSATLNGRDASDWFVFTNLVQNATYHLAFTNRYLSSDAANLTARLYTNATDAAAGTNPWKSLPGLPALTNGVHSFTNAAAGGDLYLELKRDAANRACVQYTLVYACDWIKPVFGFESGTATPNDTTNKITVRVLRTGNTSVISAVPVRTVDGSALAGSDYTAVTTNLTFATNEVARTLDIPIIPDGTVWRGNRQFAVVLGVNDGSWDAAAPTNVTVTIQETAAACDARDGADGVADAGVANAWRLAMSRDPQAIAGTLNWIDLEDWFVFTNMQAGVLYRVSISNLLDIGALNLHATFYTNAATAQAGANAWTNLPLAALTTNFNFKALTTNDLYLALQRAPGGVAPVCVQYTLNYRELVPCAIGFLVDAVTVSEAASEVTLQVRRVAEEALDSEARADIATRAGTATANDDYAPTHVTLTWQPADPDIQTVVIPLRNYNTLWEGDETFYVDLTPDANTAQAGAHTTVAVTLTEKDAPGVSQIAFAGYGPATNALELTTRIGTREGEVLTFWLTRTGRAGVVKTVLTWTDGAVKTSVTNQTWSSGVEGFGRLDVTVPTLAGYQPVRTLVLTLTAIGATVETGRGTATLNVADAAFTQTLTAYSSDRSKIPFRASGAWFGTGDGTVLRCVPPAKGGSAILQATVTGPGELSFNAQTFDATGCTFTVRVGAGVAQAVATGAVNRLTVPAGTQTIVWTFTRGTASGADAYGQISDIQWVSDEARETIGTFDGYALGEEGDGLATMSVAVSGRISGRLQFARTTYTFSVAGYNKGNYQATNVIARSGTQRVVLGIVVDPATGEAAIVNEDGDPVAILFRNGWSDKPLTAARAEAIRAYEGYYTVVLPDAQLNEFDTFGSGYLAQTVAPNGSVKTAGKLADGTPVSLSGTLIWSASGIFTIIFTAPVAYEGGYFFSNTADFEGVGNGTAILSGGASWINRNLAATCCSGFEREVGLVGGFYDKTQTLTDYYAGVDLSIGAITNPPPLVTGYYGPGGVREVRTNDAVAWATSTQPVSLVVNAAGTGFVVTDEGKAADRQARFTMTVNHVTGLFQGLVRADYTYEIAAGLGRTSTHAFQYQGALVPQRADPDDGVEGRGYFLAPEPVGTGSLLKQSYDLTIER